MLLPLRQSKIWNSLIFIWGWVQWISSIFFVKVFKSFYAVAYHKANLWVLGNYLKHPIPITFFVTVWGIIDINKLYILKLHNFIIFHECVTYETTTKIMIAKCLSNSTSSLLTFCNVSFLSFLHPSFPGYQSSPFCHCGLIWIFLTFLYKGTDGVCTLFCLTSFT